MKKLRIYFIALGIYDLVLLGVSLAVILHILISERSYQGIILISIYLFLIISISVLNIYIGIKFNQLINKSSKLLVVAPIIYLLITIPIWLLNSTIRQHQDRIIVFFIHFLVLVYLIVNTKKNRVIIH
jgi:hypothetical protein